MTLGVKHVTEVLDTDNPLLTQSFGKSCQYPLSCWNAIQPKKDDLSDWAVAVMHGVDWCCMV